MGRSGKRGRGSESEKARKRPMYLCVGGKEQERAQVGESGERGAAVARKEEWQRQDKRSGKGRIRGVATTG